MFIKSLTISDEAGVIREIFFRNGINLIVDETPNVHGKETGNNVGKTTVLMLIDFCLGANPKHVYTDPENKKEEYKLVKDFLIENKVLITLVIKEDLSIPESKEVIIERNFLPRSRKIQRIDGVAKTEDEFEATLTNLLFPGHYGKKPTFRQIIAHNIRYKDLSINNTLRILDSYTRDDEYETLYLFLLDCHFDEGDVKQQLLAQLRVEQSFKSRLEKNQTKSAYETALALLEEEIETLNQRKSNFNLNENFESDLDKLNDVRYKINRVTSQIAKLNLRRQLIIEAQEDLQADTSDIDVQQLRQIYEQATAFVGSIQKTFEDLQEFHNQMIAEKIRYISKDLPHLDEQIKSNTGFLNHLLSIEASVASELSRSDSFEELEVLIGDLNERYRRKGEYENIIKQLAESESNISELNNRLEEIDDKLFSDEFEEKVKEQVNKFNKFFASISQQLYGEKYALKADPIVSPRTGQRLYKFSAFNTNFSSGKKQGEISCFDIAYTLFADQEGIPCFHFLLNDKKELMHDNQLLKIAELVDKNGIQFVASILRDKLPDELNQDKYIVVRLSQADKLFRIESGKVEGKRQ